MTSSAPTQHRDDSELLDGRYRLDALVGEGGYARVYRATDEALGRQVAIKLFTIETPDARDLQRMNSETRLLATLNHPSLVTLYDARLDAHPGYLVMEFIDGPTLRSVIAEGPLDPQTTADIAVQLGEALQVIHAAGVVHRDIKPSNVLMRPPPIAGAARATLADFGIASLVDATSRITATGTLVGTAAYLSPEQARGEPPAPSTDIYSLGLVLLEALSGKRAFAQRTPHEALAARLVRSPEVPAVLAPDWRTLLSGMTALEAAHRPDAAAVVRAALRLRDGAGVLPSPADVATLPLDEPSASLATGTTLPLDAAAPSPERENARRRTPRWIWWAAASLAVAIVATVVIAFAIMTSAPPSHEPTLPPLPEPLGTHFEELWRRLGS